LLCFSQANQDFDSWILIWVFCTSRTSRIQFDSHITVKKTSILLLRIFSSLKLNAVSPLITEQCVTYKCLYVQGNIFEISVRVCSISQKAVSTIAVNPSGEWLAFGCSSVGQLLVWEWQSESYILKQQGHFYDMNVLAYSPDGQLVATGGDDGKVSSC
jgi:WD40 repeat protein